MGNGWGCYDLGLQNENFVLKAAELGYGTLIMGLRDGEQLRKVLDIPEEETVVAVLLWVWQQRSQRGLDVKDWMRL